MADVLYFIYFESIVYLNNVLLQFLTLYLLCIFYSLRDINLCVFVLNTLQDVATNKEVEYNNVFNIDK